MIQRKLHGSKAYHIFVIRIFFTQVGFFDPNILHPKIMKNTQKLQQIAQEV